LLNKSVLNNEEGKEKIFGKKTSEEEKELLASRGRTTLTCARLSSELLERRKRT